MSDSHNDPFFNVLWDKFGDSGIVIFWVTCELYAKEFDKIVFETEKKVRLSWVDYRRKLRKKSKQTKLVLSFCQQEGRINWVLDDDYIYIEIPKFVDLADEYTQKMIAKKKKIVGIESGHYPEKVRLEVEEDKKKNIKNSVPLSPEEKGDTVGLDIFEFIYKYFPEQKPKDSRGGRKGNRKSALEAWRKILPEEHGNIKKSISGYRKMLDEEIWRASCSLTVYLNRGDWPQYLKDLPEESEKELTPEEKVQRKIENQKKIDEVMALRKAHLAKQKEALNV